MFYQHRLGFFPLLLTLGMACGGEPVLAPKERAYPRITYPKGGPDTLPEGIVPLHLVFPGYYRVNRDSVPLRSAPDEGIGFNLWLPEWDGTIHFSYLPISKERPLDQLIAEAFRAARFHNKRANYIEELPLNLSPEVGGMAFYMKGPAATPFQFFVTDRERHFLRGVVYVRAPVNTDSLAPVHAFLIGDVQKMVAGISWQN